MDSATGIGNLPPFEDLDIYPNPATDQVTVKPGKTGTLDLTLYNYTGIKVWTGEVAGKRVIPTAMLARGIYFLQVSDKKTGLKEVQKLILR